MQLYATQVKVSFKYGDETVTGKIIFRDLDSIEFGQKVSYDIMGDDGILYKKIPGEDILGLLL